MDQLWQLFHQYWPVLFLLPFAQLIWPHLKRDRAKTFLPPEQGESGGQGLSHQLPVGHDRQNGVAQGTHRFSGTTHGVAWQAEVTLLQSEVDDGAANRRNSNQYHTRWTAPMVKTGGGAVLVMGLPDGVKSPTAAGASPGHGLLASLASKAEWLAFQTYMRLHFGHTRVNGLPLAAEHHVPLAPLGGDPGFVAFANPPELIKRVSTQALSTLAEKRQQRAAMLWDNTGLSLSWPVAIVDPEEVARLADDCAEFAGSLADVFNPR